MNRHFYLCPMRGKLLLFIFSSFFSLISRAQFTISGRVLNESGSDPVSKASVYINNSTIGAASNEQGEYVMHDIKPGVYEVIVSHVGFEVIVYKIEIKSADVRLTFKLVPKVKEMRDILVVTSSQREKWLAILRENFLGLTLAADRSKILNEDDIFFEKGQTKNVVKAFSEVPLIVENKELGYRIYFELQEFYFDATEGRTLFFGFSRYEEMGDPDSEPRKKYIRNREKTYKGSTLHFYHSLLSNNIDEQGFSIYITRPADSAKSAHGNAPVMNGGTITVKSPAPQIAYTVSRKDILFTDSTDSSRKYLSWKGTLQVRYKFDPYYKAALQKKLFVAGNLPKGFQSSVIMLEPPAYLDPNGILINPLAVQFSGFWSYEKLANMLPINYRPE
jgi:CRISPR/Cas system CMR-associated protein Cmr5 small subunit